MDFSAATAPDFAALHCFSKSKSICADASAKIRAIHAIWTPQNGGKRGGCVLSRAKVYLLFRIIEISSKKKLIYRETILSPIKTSGLSYENTLVLHSSSHLFRESRPPNLPPLSALSSRTRTCARTDTHLHIAHSTSLFFLPSPFTFTPNSLSHCGLRVKKTIYLTLHG